MTHVFEIKFSTWKENYGDPFFHRFFVFNHDKYEKDVEYRKKINGVISMLEFVAHIIGNELYCFTDNKEMSEEEALNLIKGLHNSKSLTQFLEGREVRT